MSQKTNPTSLRLQKTSQNFAFPWFADYFWNQAFEACIESQKYINAFLKETSFSKAFFSTKLFYRKLPVFVFLQDNRITKKEKLLFFKKPLSITSVSKNDQKSHLLKKNISKNKSFSIGSERINTLFFVVNINDNLRKKSHNEPVGNLLCFFKNNIFSKDLKLVKRLVRDDYLKTKQGFFKNLSYTECFTTTGWDNAVKSKEHKKFLFDKEISKTYFFLPKLPKIFVRPCLSFCENVMSSVTSGKNSLANYKPPIPLDLATNLSKKEKRYKTTLHKRSTKTTIFNNVIKTPFFTTSTILQPIRFLRENQNVWALADQVVFLLERRISFRQIKYFIFKDLLLDPQIKGVRISCSGRLGGRSKKAQKAKVQSDCYGATTLATFSSKIIFASKSAYTPYGKVGVKIWLSFSDKRCA